MLHPWLHYLCCCLRRVLRPGTSIITHVLYTGITLNLSVIFLEVRTKSKSSVNLSFSSKNEILWVCEALVEGIGSDLNMIKIHYMKFSQN